MAMRPTRGGVKRVHIAKDSEAGGGTAGPGAITSHMGRALLTDDDVTVVVGERGWPARNVNMGNPHAVAFVDDLDRAGTLFTAPSVTPESVYPDGVNVEFVVGRGPRHVAMRVHERGSGETRSCGTGACAVMVAAAVADGARPAGEDVDYRVDVPGGTLTVTWTVGDRVLLRDPGAAADRATGRPVFGATVLDVAPPRLRGNGAAAAAERELERRHGLDPLASRGGWIGIRPPRKRGR